MKKIIVSLGLALTLSFGATVDEGEAAYKKGDYKIALTIFAFLILLTSIIMKLFGTNSLGVGISFFAILIFLLYILHPIKIFIFRIIIY